MAEQFDPDVSKILRKFLHKEDNKKIREALDKSSSYNRALLTIFLGLLAYVFATASTTTDMMLLLANSTIKLPILGIEFPLLYFFFFSPVIILIFHINLLLNLSLHAENYSNWLDIKYDNAPSHLSPFTFNYYVKYDSSKILQLTVKFIINLLYFFAPIVTLFWTAYKFLPYHYEIDIIKFFNLDDNTNVFLSFDLKHFIFATVLHVSVITIDAIVSLFFYWKIKKQFAALRVRYFLIIFSALLGILIITYFVMSLPKQHILPDGTTKLDNKTWVDRIFHRYIELPNRTIVSKEVSDLIVQHYLSKGKKKEEAIKEQSEKLDLKKRNLIYSDFRSATFINADLSWANLQGAALWGANLQGAALWGANLQGVDLWMTNLQGAALWGANLQGADLSWANLQGVALSWANLQGADLWGAELQGAVLWGANLQGADLSMAKLQGAELGRGKLQVADLWLAKLLMTDLWLAKLLMTDVSDANLNCCIINDSTNFEGIHYDNISKLFERDNFSTIDNKTAGRCKSFDEKSKANLQRRLERAMNPKLFLDVNKKLACTNSILAKTISGREGTVILDNGTKVSFEDEIRKHMKKNCPHLVP
ncbi:MAG: pentapeptide repeat-containing protein [Nitrospirota bacterium]